MRLKLELEMDPEGRYKTLEMPSCFQKVWTCLHVESKMNIGSLLDRIEVSKYDKDRFYHFVSDKIIVGGVMLLRNGLFEISFMVSPKENGNTLISVYRLTKRSHV